MNDKKQVAKISIFITSIFVIFLSVTYAFITQVITGEKNLVIQAGTLDLVLEEENEITITDALPMYDEVGMIQDDVFNFSLVNKTSNPTNYVLKLNKISTSNELNPSQVKYYLTKDGVGAPKLLSTLTNGKVDEGTIDGSATIEYSLRLWIDSDVTNKDDISGKSLSYKVSVEAGQLEEAKYVGMIKATTSSSTEAFWNYRDQITSIAFEPEISVPDSLEISPWDVSVNQDKSVMSYIEDDGTGNGTYKLHIQAKNKIYTNTDSSWLFWNFSKLTEITGMEYVDTSKTTNMGVMFQNCRSLTSLDVSNFDTSSVTDMTQMFNSCSKLISLDLSNFVTSKVEGMSLMFSDCSGLTTLDVSNFDTSNVTNMSYMFRGCSGLTSLDVSNFDTPNVTNMSYMFYSCRSLTGLDVSNFDTSNVMDMQSMFYQCCDLTSLDLSNFDTSNVRYMKQMFGECYSLASLNVTNFDTSKVRNMSDMFFKCQALTNLDLSSFNTSNVTNMAGMFYGCRTLTNLNLSNMDFDFEYECGEIFFGVPIDCLIIVKDETTKTWMTSGITNLTNVQVKSV